MGATKYRGNYAPRNASLAERLAHHSKPDMGTGCRLWTASTIGRGYGQMTFKGIKSYAHRMAWVAAHGPIPDDMHVLHRCDVPICINPEHLFLGTNADNMADKIAKGRQGPPLHGVRSGMAKLTDADVVAIRADVRSHAAIARDFGVKAGAVSKIKRRQRWAHVA